MRVPSTVGGYRVLRELGRGAMGVVVEAEHCELGVVRALKLMAPGGPERAQRFAREVRALARVQHPNVVAVHESGTLPDGSLFYAMDRVEGQSLGALLAAEGALPYALALELAIGVARGVEALHRAGVVHRDLKPDNVVRAADGRPVVLDLGLAFEPGSDDRLTRTGTFVGTPAYLAPEQIDGRREQLSPRTDVYALGLVCFELFTGQAAVEVDSSQLELLGRIMSTDRPSPSSVDPDLPLALDAVCCKAMSRAPEARYADAGVLAGALEGLREGGTPTRRQRRQRTVLLASGAVGLMLLAGLAATWDPPHAGPAGTTAEVGSRQAASAGEPARQRLDPRVRARGERALRRIERRLAEGRQQAVAAEIEKWLRDYPGHPDEPAAREIARRTPYLAPLKTFPLRADSGPGYRAWGLLLDEGRHLLMAYRDGAWAIEVASGRRSLVDLPGPILCMLRLPSGDAWVCLAGQAYRVSPSGAATHLYPLPSRSYAARLVAGGSQIALGASKESAYLLNAETGAIDQVFTGHTVGSYDIDLLPGGERLVTVSGVSNLEAMRVSDCTLRLFDVETGRLLRSAPLDGRGTRVLASADGARIHTADDLGRILTFDAESLERISELKGRTNEKTLVEQAALAHNQAVRYMALSRDGRRLYTGAGGTRNRLVGNAFAVWDAVTGAELARFGYGRRLIESYSVCPATDGRGDRLLVVGGDVAELWLLDPQLGAE